MRDYFTYYQLLDSMKIHNHNEFCNVLYQHVLILKPYSEILVTRLFPNSSPSETIKTNDLAGNAIA